MGMPPEDQRSAITLVGGFQEAQDACDEHGETELDVLFLVRCGGMRAG